MANVVTFEMNADMEKAVRGIMKVVEAQKTAETAHAKSASKASDYGKSVESSTSKAEKAVNKYIRSFATVAVATKAIMSLAEGFQAAAQKVVSFETEMTGLLSLGRNAWNIGSMKQEVVSLSNQWGKSSQEIADAMFAIQSGAGSLSAVQQKDLRDSSLKLTKALGGDLATNVNALTKSFLIYQDEVKGTTDLTNKLALTAQDAAVTMQDLATYLPQVSGPAKALGYSLNDVTGALIVATQIGGKTESTFTGMRNIFLKMNEAIKEGLTHQGAFIEQINELATKDPNVIAKFFGNESAETILNIAQNTELVAAAIKKVHDVTGDIPGDIIKTRESDPAYKAAMELSQLKEAQANVGKAGPNAGVAAQNIADWEARKLSFKNAATNMGGIGVGMANSDWWTFAGASLLTGLDVLDKVGLAGTGMKVPYGKTEAGKGKRIAGIDVDNLVAGKGSESMQRYFQNQQTQMGVMAFGQNPAVALPPDLTVPPEETRFSHPLDKGARRLRNLAIEERNKTSSRKAEISKMFGGAYTGAPLTGDKLKGVNAYYDMLGKSANSSFDSATDKAESMKRRSAELAAQNSPVTFNDNRTIIISHNNQLPSTDQVRFAQQQRALMPGVR